MSKNKNLSSRETIRLKMDKDRKKEKQKKLFFKLGIIAVILAFVGTLTYIGVKDVKDNKVAMEPAVSLTPENVQADGSFYYSPDGLKEPKADSDAIRVDSFFDPQCPGCGFVDRAIGDRLGELTDSGEIDLYLTPVSFLDNSSGDRYSSRAANAMVTVSEKSPKNALDFMNAIFAEDFQPSGGKTPSDEELTTLAIKLGVSEDIANTFKDHSYFEWIKENTEIQTNRTDLFPAGFSTPGVFLNVEYGTNNVATNFTKVAFEGGDPLALFNEAYKTTKEG